MLIQPLNQQIFSTFVMYNLIDWLKYYFTAVKIFDLSLKINKYIYMYNNTKMNCIIFLLLLKTFSFIEQL